MILEQNGVRLRLLKREDFEALWEMYTPEIFRHMLFKLNSLEEMAGWLEDGLNQSNVIVFAVEQADSGKIVGTTRIFAIDDKNRSCEIGSTFYSQDVQGTYINKGAKSALLSYCFEEREFLRVQFKTDAENIRSQKALESIGAVREGVLRNERIRSSGEPRDAVVYSIIADEWPEVKRKLTNKMNKYS